MLISFLALNITMSTNPEIRLGKYTISKDSPCFVIAELGHNHGGSLETAKRMVISASQNGAHAVKLQKRSNKDLFTKEMYDKPYENENSYGKTYGLHREALELNYEQYMELKKLADALEVVLFATPFDFQSVDFLEKVGVPCYKIASALITDIPLIDYVASKGKPVFISTGGCTLADIDRAYTTVKKHKVPLVLMQCTASYPQMDYGETHLNVFKTFAQRYPDVILGFSSHDSGIMLPIGAYMLGSRVVEKHFTLNRAMRGTDHSYSLEPAGLRKMSRDLQRLHEAMGTSNKLPQPSEKNPIFKMGKSIVARVDIKAGDMLTPEKLCFKCPANGLPPYMIYDVLGRMAVQEIKTDQPLTKDSVGKQQVRKYQDLPWGNFYGADS